MACHVTEHGCRVNGRGFDVMSPSVVEEVRQRMIRLRTHNFQAILTTAIVTFDDSGSPRDGYLRTKAMPAAVAQQYLDDEPRRVEDKSTTLQDRSNSERTVT